MPLMTNLDRSFTKDLIKNTVSGHPDEKNLQDALQNIKELADYINANKHNSDEVTKILAIQNQLIGWPQVYNRILSNS
jgi:hypothetical protein